jgi:hypothetical protein
MALKQYPSNEFSFLIFLYIAHLIIGWEWEDLIQLNDGINSTWNGILIFN